MINYYFKNNKKYLSSIFYILMVLYVVFYILYSRQFLFNLGPYDESKKQKHYLHHYKSESINIDKKGEYSFFINAKKWPYKNELNDALLSVALVFKDIDTIKAEKYINSNLEVEINAYAINKDIAYDRLVKNVDFPSNRIILKSLSSYGDASI
jgi:hypothetical protein